MPLFPDIRAPGGGGGVEGLSGVIRMIVTNKESRGGFKVTQPLQNDKNRQKYFFPDFCLILIFNPRTTFCEIFGVKILGGVL